MSIFPEWSTELERELRLLYISATPTDNPSHHTGLYAVWSRLRELHSETAPVTEFDKQVDEAVASVLKYYDRSRDLTENKISEWLYDTWKDDVSTNLYVDFCTAVTLRVIAACADE